MYVPPHFTENQYSEVLRIVENCGLATLAANGKIGLLGDHLPLVSDIYEGQLVSFRGHLSLNNPIFNEVEDDAECLLIFKANDSYISPNWYPSKAIHHKHVPTWNYQAVHFKCKIQFCHENIFKRQLLAQLTRIHETRIGESNPWKMSQAPNEYIDQLLEKIVGLKFEIIAIEAKSKLSQNRDIADVQGTIENLTRIGNSEMAREISRKIDPQNTK